MQKIAENVKHLGMLGSVARKGLAGVSWGCPKTLFLGDSPRYSRKPGFAAGKMRPFYGWEEFNGYFAKRIFFTSDT